MINMEAILKFDIKSVIKSDIKSVIKSDIKFNISTKLTTWIEPRRLEAGSFEK